MTIVGLAGALVYDFYRALRELKGLKKKATLVGDMAYSLLFITFFILILLRLNDGQLRSYVYLGLILGYAAYFGLLHRFLRRPITLLCRGVCFVAGGIWAILTYPWRLTAKALARPWRAARARALARMQSKQAVVEEDLE